MKELDGEPGVVPEITNQNQAASENKDLLGLEQTLEHSTQYHPVNLRQSFSHALSGIKETLANERNFKIHLCCAVIALSLACLLKIDLINWLILIQVITLVLTAELINTAVEYLVDLASGSFYHPLAKSAKDIAAGAVFIASANALVSGILIFGPRLLPLFDQALRHVR